MQVTSNAFEEGQPIPAKYTCDGEDISPRLKWMGVPAEAVGIVNLSWCSHRITKEDKIGAEFSHDYRPTRCARGSHRDTTHL